MAFSVVMPALEMAQETGKLIAWRKKEGEAVTKGEPLLEVETDKAVMEIESPADGVLAGISGVVGSDIPVGQTIAWIVAPGESAPTGDSSSSAAPAARAKSENSQPAASSAVSHTVPSAAAKISPKARRLAKELSVSISSLRGSGPGGEILASDIQAVASQTPAAPAAVRSNEQSKIEVPTSIGRLMAERTTQSWTTVPHFFVTREIDAAALNAAREEKKSGAGQGERPTHTDLLVALVAKVLLKHPRLNASWSPAGIQLHDEVNIGVAVAINDGVVTAVIHGAGKATLAEIVTQRVAVTDRARAGKLRPADIAGATFTVSNLGMFHVDSFTAIIIPPQAAILAVGAIADRILAVQGNPVVRPMMTLTLSCDHRVADGARAAAFMCDLAEAIQHPEKLL